MEGRKGLILQAHFDMVPQKNGDKSFDFQKDGIEAYIDGEWVKANGTTLGADNGVGLAAILAAFESKEIKHGPLEALITASEETGMVGAFGLKSGLLEGDILINLDSEEEGELCVGCAGGMDANAVLKYDTDRAPKSGYLPVQIEVKGLKGGHSGVEIILERANANKILIRFLKLSQTQHQMKLSMIDGGGLRNAIPREATAQVVIPENMIDKFKSDLADYERVVAQEFKGVENSISVKATVCSMPERVMEAEFQSKLIAAVYGCPNGIISMSKSIKELVQTSTNLARVVSDGHQVAIQSFLRSSIQSEREMLGEMICSVMELAGAQVKLEGRYDGWTPNMDSPILKTMVESYKSLFGKKPEVKAIHAGLECGIISGPYPELDMISFGPTILFPHSPDEKVNIPSVAKFWDFLVHTIENAPLK